MRKRLWIGIALALAAAICLACAAAAAEEAATGTAGSEEELMAGIAKNKEAGSQEFDIQLTDEYFEALRENSFNRLTVLKLKAGLDCKVQYTAEGKLLFRQVKWTEYHAAECATEAEVREAIAGFLADEAYAFQIICGNKELYDSLYQKNLIFAYAAMGGAEDMRVQNTLGDPYIYYCTQIKRYTVPYAVAENEEEFLNAFQYMAGENAEHFFVAVEPALYEQMRKDGSRLEWLEACTPMEDWRSKNDPNFCRVEYTGVRFTTNPRIVCETEEDIVEAIRQTGASGHKAFNLVLTEELYETVQKSSGLGQFGRLQELEAEAGMSESRMKYSPYTHVLMYTGAVIHSDAVKLTTAAEACAYAEECVKRGDREIMLFCTEALYKLLKGNISPFAIASTSMSPIYDVLPQAGINDFSFSYNDASHLFDVKVTSFFPGTEIMNAVRAGDESGLTDREKETLEAARKIAEQCAGGDELETAKNIHDYLCRKITYTNDETTDEDDTAIGAILNGEANCDGYTDAFYLAGSLAGLEVRYQHGDSKDLFGKSIMSDITHIWNLLKIDGSWRMVDVTWDDREEGPAYTWFNIGEDRASRMHIWNRETTVALLAETDLDTRPENEYCVRTNADVREAAKDALAKGFTGLEIILADGAETDVSAAFKALDNTLNRRFTYSKNEYMKTVTVSGIE